MKGTVFIVDISVHYILLLTMIWSIAFPKKRIWPPPKKQSWQYFTIWALFYMALVLNTFLLVMDWNTWVIPGSVRFFVGIPITIIGSLFVSWGFATLGAKNTSGIKTEFIDAGPYRFTRNPQYIGDIFLFTGISLLSNSLYLTIAHVLGAMIFLITPLAEEGWLEQQYGEQYIRYKSTTPRFF